MPHRESTWPSAIALGMLVACVWSPLAGVAAESGADDIPLLRRTAEVDEAMKGLPPFLRDTDLKLHLRSYYFNSRDPGEVPKEAWAAGGWLEYASGWLLDAFQIGTTIYTSIPLYAPDDRDGTLLLKPGQRGFIVPGIAYGALRYKDYALLTGYRQLVDQTYVNPHDNRMAPNTFEGVTLKGNVEFVEYLVGYLTRMKQRDADDFISMAEAAGVKDNGGGLVLAGMNLTPWPGVRLTLSDQYGQDVFNTAYARADYAYAVTPELRLTLSGQYTDQRAVGGDLLDGSKFKAWATSVGGALVALKYHDLALIGAFSMTGKGNDIQAPFGAYPGYLRLIVKDFNRASETAWLAGASYNFSRALVSGLIASFNYAQGTGAIDPRTRAPAPDEREYDVNLIYKPATGSVLRGFSFATHGGVVDVQGKNQLGYQIRLILNYEIPLF